MTPDKPDGADALSELADWLKTRMVEERAELAYSPRLDRDGREWLRGYLTALSQTLRRIESLSRKGDSHDTQ